MGKRANGEGSVYKRADGRWGAALSYQDASGAMRRRMVYGATQAEARIKLRELRARIEAGVPVKDSTLTLAAWLDTWMTGSLPASDRRQATVDLYSHIARRHLLPTLGSKRIDKIRPTDVEMLVVMKRQEGLAQSTVRTIYTVLRAALDTAVRDGLLTTNPTAAIRRPPVRRRDAAFLSVDDAQRLLEALAGERLEPLFRLMLSTGLRRGEALGLHWEDVDLDRRQLRVRWTLTRTTAGLQLGEPKTKLSRRVVPLPQSLVNVLEAHSEQQKSEAVAIGSAWQNEDLVFATEVGTFLEPRNVLRRFVTISRRAGLDDVHLHTLRHSTASFLLAAGVHIKVVQELLGHASYAITADTYSHVAPEQRREAADRIEDSLDW
ncbi:tyrosine-type recombinase/integrase [Modestobacter sp. Leaf380]|uniref:tyrosine-type recombinase/integrase n=1 Tax=Modestobacter sp. Leaf380 TaxID=1736356 RepID=UPI000700D1C8|nr:tyrosine-type recombinase/integrase [Modestobacter sp. Leaf380]KQS64336.1 hypothetical protein ASG41_17000 [Modestobacter sp. Leaf380]